MDLTLTRSDAVMFIYSVGAVLSGALAVTIFDITDRLLMVGVSLVIGLFWAGYFKWNIRRRFELIEKLDEERERRQSERELER